MTTQFKVGDKVKWKFVYGETEGEIIEVLTENLKTSANPVTRYKVKSSKTGKTAIHKAEALTKI
ncbi:DUF2945 domain-containing protein [Holosporaceae bacterium 'Namur']|nr:DUF2945 domain-containing protein [Holosporaceae bacterium 'Namur']